MHRHEQAEGPGVWTGWTALGWMALVGTLYAGMLLRARPDILSSAGRFLAQLLSPRA